MKSTYESRANGSAKVIETMIARLDEALNGTVRFPADVQARQITKRAALIEITFKLDRLISARQFKEACAYMGEVLWNAHGSLNNIGDHDYGIHAE